MVSRHIVWVLYDSIGNSVFESQVLAPIERQLSLNKYQIATIVSFERNVKNAEKILVALKVNPKIQVTLLSRSRFFGKIGLWPASLKLKKSLENFEAYNIVARGPLAGWIALHTLKSLETKKNKSLTISARGLAAEEYKFTLQNKPTKWYMWPIHWTVYKSLVSIEKKAYSEKHLESANFKIHIHSVSNALKDYLIDTFKASPKRISICIDDIPPNTPKAQRQIWHNSMRSKLGIASNKTVYCYSGSTKSWQCIPATIKYFASQLKANNNAFLLVLTADVEVFENQLKIHKIPPEVFCVSKVPPTQLIRYLCAGDIGILMRQAHVINWVSRPTKALEYIAACLKVAHNGTVKWILDQTTDSLIMAQPKQILPS